MVSEPGYEYPGLFGTEPSVYTATQQRIITYTLVSWFVHKLLRNRWCPNQDPLYPDLLVIIGALTRFISPGLVGTEPSVYTVTQPLHYTPTLWPLRLELMVT